MKELKELVFSRALLNNLARGSSLNRSTNDELGASGKKTEQWKE